MAKRFEKVINPKISVFLFNKENPKGEMFNFVGGKDSDEYKAMLENGWFDTPSRLNLPKDDELDLTIEQATNANPTDLVKLVESFGFIVLTPEQLSAEANKMASVALDITKFGDDEFIAEAERRGLKEPDGEEQLDLVGHEEQSSEDDISQIFRYSPKKLTKEQLKAFGNDNYGLSLTMNHSEQTMIDKITEAMGE